MDSSGSPFGSQHLQKIQKGVSWLQHKRIIWKAQHFQNQACHLRSVAFLQFRIPKQRRRLSQNNRRMTLECLQISDAKSKHKQKPKKTEKYKSGTNNNSKKLPKTDWGRWWFGGLFGTPKLCQGGNRTPEIINKTTTKQNCCVTWFIHLCIRFSMRNLAHRVHGESHCNHPCLELYLSSLEKVQILTHSTRKLLGGVVLGCGDATPQASSII